MKCLERGVNLSFSVQNAIFLRKLRFAILANTIFLKKQQQQAVMGCKCNELFCSHFTHYCDSGYKLRNRMGQN